MDNMITGVLGTVVFAAFALGLAESIGATPFVIIVVVVVILLLIDLVQSVREGFRETKNGNQD